MIRPLEGLPVSAPRPKPLLEVDLKPCDALFLPAGLEGRVPSVAWTGRTVGESVGGGKGS